MLTNRLGMAIARFRRPALAPDGPDFSTAQIGDEIGGGIYAGIDTIDGTNYHIIAGKSDSNNVGAYWKNDLTSTPGTSSDSDGLANTQAMQAAGISNHPAAEHCVNYAGGGNNDWHMPAKSQIVLMQSTLSGHPEFTDVDASSNYLFSSTEVSASDAWGIRFYDGDLQGVYKKNAGRMTRPIRRVPA